MRKAGLELLRTRAGESVLEIGFGTGHSLVALAKAVGPKGTVFGVDLSDKMLQRAKTSLAKFNLLARAHLRCADATQLPYEANSMDAVFMSFTVELFDTPEIPTVLRECKRVLRLGGRIVVVACPKTPNATSLPNPICQICQTLSFSMQLATIKPCSQQKRFDLNFRGKMSSSRLRHDLSLA